MNKKALFFYLVIKDFKTNYCNVCHGQTLNVKYTHTTQGEGLLFYQNLTLCGRQFEFPLFYEDSETDQVIVD